MKVSRLHYAPTHCRMKSSKCVELISDRARCAADLPKKGVQRAMDFIDSSQALIPRRKAAACAANEEDAALWRWFSGLQERDGSVGAGRPVRGW